MLLGSVFLDLSPVVYVILAAVAGILLQVKKIPDKKAPANE